MKTGYILKCDNPSDLEYTLTSLDKFKIKKYKSNNENFVKLIEDYIDKL